MEHLLSVNSMMLNSKEFLTGQVARLTQYVGRYMKLSNVMQQSCHLQVKKVPAGKSEIPCNLQAQAAYPFGVIPQVPVMFFEIAQKLEQ